MATVVQLLLAYSGSDYDCWGFKLTWILIKNVFRRTVAASVLRFPLHLHCLWFNLCSPRVCRVTTKFWAKANCPSSPWSSRPSSSAAGPRRRSRLLEEPACWWHRAPLTLFLQNKLCKWGILVCFHAAQCYCRFKGDFQILGPFLYSSKCSCQGDKRAENILFNFQISFLD